MSMTLLRTKLFRPLPRAAVVTRARLHARLNSGLEGRLTLVSAPPGFGKSTLLGSWAGSAPLPCAWLTLDEGDNEPTQFWRYVDSALRTVPAVRFPEDEAAYANQPNHGADELAIGLINRLTEVQGSRAVLILDDYHTIRNPELQSAMHRFVDALPPALHLVIAGRTDPPWPLARWRSRGELTEVRAPELRFTAEEAAAFLTEVMGLALTPAEITVLEERTEGWIAGLQMAALSMAGRQDLSSFIETLSGSHRFIMDYLVEEVLNRQPEARRNFLLQTSILERMKASLCESVAQVDDGQAMLIELEQANLFIAPLDDERRWYRYHQLFGELLRDRLARQQPAEVETLHLRASRWFEAHGLLAEAMRHAAAAGDVDRQVSIIANNALRLAYLGELTMLIQWLEALPDELGAHEPWFHVSQSWVLAFAGRLEDVEAELQAAEQSLEAFGACTPEGQSKARALCDHVNGHIAAIRGYLAGFRGRTEESLDYVNTALALIGSEDRIARGWATLLKAVELRALQDNAAADAAFDEAAALARAADSIPLTTDVLWEWSWLQLVQGKLHSVMEKCEMVLDLAETYLQKGGRRLAPTGYIHIGIAAVYYEWNELERALEHAQEAVQLSQRWGMADARIRSQLQLATILVAMGQREEAESVLHDMKRLAATISPFYAHLGDGAIVRNHFAQGNLDAVREWATDQALSVDVDDDELTLGAHTHLARLLMTAGLKDQPDRLAARDLLERLRIRATAASANSILIEILVLSALNFAALHDEGAALEALATALRLGEPEGFVHRFVREGEELRPLLLSALAQGIAPTYVARLLDELDASPAASSETGLTAALAEPLTERELAVLRMLATTLSTTEIAAELIVAPSTVRTHIKRIYGKLDVHNRREATAKAAELGLLT